MQDANGLRPTKRLKFGHGNAKIDEAVFTFSLPAGWACPFAYRCLARTDKRTGKTRDGRDTTIRCFASSDEQIRPSVRNARWGNYNLLRKLSRKGMARLILDSLSPLAGIVRVHVSGDFFSQDYFDAWLDVARKRASTKFYFYTKSLRFWLARLEDVGDGHTPGSLLNVVPTASYGGRDDPLISHYGLRSARVVFCEDEAHSLGLEVDTDDSYAMRHGPDFALLIHGMQPAGTPAAKAVSTLRARGEFGYGKRAKARRLSLTVLQESL